MLPDTLPQLPKKTTSRDLPCNALAHPLQSHREREAIVNRCYEPDIYRTRIRFSPSLHECCSCTATSTSSNSGDEKPEHINDASSSCQLSASISERPTVFCAESLPAVPSAELTSRRASPELLNKSFPSLAVQLTLLNGASATRVKCPSIPRVPCMASATAASIRECNMLKHYACAPCADPPQAYCHHNGALTSQLVAAGDAAAAVFGCWSVFYLDTKHRVRGAATVLPPSSTLPLSLMKVAWKIEADMSRNVEQGKIKDRLRVNLRTGDADDHDMISVNKGEPRNSNVDKSNADTTVGTNTGGRTLDESNNDCRCVADRYCSSVARLKEDGTTAGDVSRIRLGDMLSCTPSRTTSNSLPLWLTCSCCAPVLPACVHMHTPRQFTLRDKAALGRPIAADPPMNLCTVSSAGYETTNHDMVKMSNTTASLVMDGDNDNNNYRRGVSDANDRIDTLHSPSSTTSSAGSAVLDYYSIMYTLHTHAASMKMKLHHVMYYQEDCGEYVLLTRRSTGQCRRGQFLVYVCDGEQRDDGRANSTSSTVVDDSHRIAASPPLAKPRAAVALQPRCEVDTHHVGTVRVPQCPLAKLSIPHDSQPRLHLSVGTAVGAGAGVTVPCLTGFDIKAAHTKPDTQDTSSRSSQCGASSSGLTSTSPTRVSCPSLPTHSTDNEDNNTPDTTMKCLIHDRNDSTRIDHDNNDNHRHYDNYRDDTRSSQAVVNEDIFRTAQDIHPHTDTTQQPVIFFTRSELRQHVERRLRVLSAHLRHLLQAESRRREHMLTWESAAHTQLWARCAAAKHAAAASAAQREQYEAWVQQQCDERQQCAMDANCARRALVTSEADAWIECIGAAAAYRALCQSHTQEQRQLCSSESALRLSAILAEEQRGWLTCQAWWASVQLAQRHWQGCRTLVLREECVARDGLVQAEWYARVCGVLRVVESTTRLVWTREESEARDLLWVRRETVSASMRAGELRRAVVAEKRRRESAMRAKSALIWACKERGKRETADAQAEPGVHNDAALPHTFHDTCSPHGADSNINNDNSDVSTGKANSTSNFSMDMLPFGQRESKLVWTAVIITLCFDSAAEQSDSCGSAPTYTTTPLIDAGCSCTNYVSSISNNKDDTRAEAIACVADERPNNVNEEVTATTAATKAATTTEVKCHKLVAELNSSATLSCPLLPTKSSSVEDRTRLVMLHYPPLQLLHEAIANDVRLCLGAVLEQVNVLAAVSTTSTLTTEPMTEGAKLVDVQSEEVAHTTTATAAAEAATHVSAEGGSSLVVQLHVQHDGSYTDNQLQHMIAVFDFPYLLALYQSYADTKDDRRSSTCAIAPGMPSTGAEGATAFVWVRCATCGDYGAAEDEVGQSSESSTSRAYDVMQVLDDVPSEYGNESEPTHQEHASPVACRINEADRLGGGDWTKKAMAEDATRHGHMQRGNVRGSGYHNTVTPQPAQLAADDHLSMIDESLGKNRLPVLGMTKHDDKEGDRNQRGTRQSVDNMTHATLESVATHAGSSVDVRLPHDVEEEYGADERDASAASTRWRSDCVLVTPYCNLMRQHCRNTTRSSVYVEDDHTHNKNDSSNSHSTHDESKRHDEASHTYDGVSICSLCSSSSSNVCNSKHSDRNNGTASQSDSLCAGEEGVDLQGQTSSGRCIFVDLTTNDRDFAAQALASKYKTVNSSKARDDGRSGGSNANCTRAVLTHHTTRMCGTEWKVVTEAAPRFLRDQFVSEVSELLGCPAGFVRNVALCATAVDLVVEFDLLQLPTSASSTRANVEEDTADNGAASALTRAQLQARADTCLRQHLYSLLLELYHSRFELVEVVLENGDVAETHDLTLLAYEVQPRTRRTKR